MMMSRGKDYDVFLETLAPDDARYRHDETGEDNVDAHIKRQIMGRDVNVAIMNGQSDFGSWGTDFFMASLMGDAASRSCSK